MVNDYFIPIYCILPKRCVVKEIFISEWRISEDCRQILDLYLREVCQRQEPREVDFEYFVPDQKKEGGSYQKKSGCIRRIDTYLNEIVLQSGDRIPLDEIVDIDGVIAAADEVL